MAGKLSSCDETRLQYAYEQTKEQWVEIMELKNVVRMLSDSVAKLLAALPTPSPPDAEEKGGEQKP